VAFKSASSGSRARQNTSHDENTARNKGNGKGVKRRKKYIIEINEKFSPKYNNNNNNITGGVIYIYIYIQNTVAVGIYNIHILYVLYIYNI